MSRGAHARELAMMRRLGSHSSQPRGVLALAPSSRPNLCRALVFALVVASVGLTGCGRRGALEPPSAAATTQPSQPGQTAKPAQNPPPPDRPFVLDPLLR